MKKILSILLVFAFLFSLSSCVLVPSYSGNELLKILESRGYEYTVELDLETDHQGVIGYVYGFKEETGDEIYYIYCEGFSSANAIFRYLKSKRNAEISELKMKIEKVQFMLDSDDVSAADKGKYYEEYVILKEQLEEVQGYNCGRGYNVVWYGTKQALIDIRLGE